MESSMDGMQTTAEDVIIRLVESDGNIGSSTPEKDHPIAQQEQEQDLQFEANLFAKGTLRRCREVVTTITNEADEVPLPPSGPREEQQQVREVNNEGDLRIAAGTAAAAAAAASTSRHDGDSELLKRSTGTEIPPGKERMSSDVDADLTTKGRHRPLQHQPTNDTTATTSSSSSSTTTPTSDDPPDETTIPGAWAVSGIALRPELIEDLSATAPTSAEDQGVSVTGQHQSTTSGRGQDANDDDEANRAEEGLAQATPINDDSVVRPEDMQRAYRDDDLSTGDSRHSSRSKLRSSAPSSTVLAGLFIVALLLVAVVAVVVAVVVLQQGKDQQSTTSENTDSISITLKEERDIQVRNRIMGALDVMSGGNARDALQDSESPHSKALHWLLYDDEMELSATASNLLQRYVVALLYYSTTQDGPWTSCNPTDQTDEEENKEENLLCYYYGLNGDGLFSNSGLLYTVHQGDTHQEQLAARWLTGGQHECQWAGLFCNDEKKLDWIQLDEMNLTGTIPNELSILEDLEALSLTKNSLQGSLTPGLGRLSKLEFLDLLQNDLSGTLPNEWWGLTNLRHINLSYNPLASWTIPPMISQWSNLQVLRVEGNQITGEIPKELYQLSDLTWLLLGANSISGTVATQIGLLSNLELLNLGGNLFSGSIPSEVSSMTDLLEFAAYGLLLSGSIPEELYLADYTRLNALILGKNHLTGTISSSIGRLSTLGYLYIDQNPYIEGRLPSEIGLLKNLMKLVVSGTQLSGTIPQEICDNRGDTFLARLKADCEPLSNGDIPLVCPEGCCTKCCNQETGKCTKTVYQDSDPLQP